MCGGSCLGVVLGEIEPSLLLHGFQEGKLPGFDELRIVYRIFEEICMGLG